MNYHIGTAEQWPQFFFMGEFKREKTCDSFKRHEAATEFFTKAPCQHTGSEEELCVTMTATMLVLLQLPPGIKKSVAYP